MVLIVEKLALPEVGVTIDIMEVPQRTSESDTGAPIGYVEEGLSLHPRMVDELGAILVFKGVKAGY